MKNLVISVLFLSLSLGVNAQAKIDFTNSTVDYGDLKAGSNGVEFFTFKNTGNKDLTITKVESTSRNIKVTKPNGSIAPGKTGKIKITYDTQKKGPIRRTITVFSNAKNSPVKALKIKGCVTD